MRFKKIIITAIVVAVPLSAFFFTLHMVASASSAEEPYSIFILAGQSNAEGTYSYRNVLPAGTGPTMHDHPGDTATGLWLAGADGQGPADGFQIIQFFSGVSSAGWVDSGDGTPNKLKNLNYAQRAGQFGSELGIGRYTYDMGRRKVIVLKVTYGFQSLAPSNSVFIPFDWNINSVNKSYARLKNEFSLLTQKIKAEGQTYTVDGFFWMQGETDTLQPSYSAAYQTYLTDLTNAARTDFQMHPASHIVAGKISLKKCVETSYPNTGNYCGFPYLGSLDPIGLAPVNYLWTLHGARHKVVRNAMQYVADHDDDKVVKMDVVETADLVRGSDNVHLSATSQIELGRRFVNMYTLPKRVEGSNDYDGDGILNNLEDTGTSACNLVGTQQGLTGGGSKASNANLGDDDCDGDNYPNYLDRVNGLGSGL